MELAPTSHGAVLRVTFPPSVPAQKRRVCAWIPQGKSSDEDEKRAQKSRSPTGHCQASGGGIDLVSRKFASGVPDGYDFALRARLEAEGMEVVEDTMPSSNCFQENMGYKPLDMPGQQRSHEDNAAACQARCARTPGCAHFTFWGDGGCHLQNSAANAEKQNGLTAGPPQCPSAQREVRQCCFVLYERTEASVRIGTSLISPAQALRSLDKEVGSKTIEEVAREGRAAWRTHLMAVEVEDAGPASFTTLRRLEIFYTCLYRALLFPRRLDEVTATGIQHWSPYDGRVHHGPGVTDNGFWDTFRTVYPLLSLAYPKKLGELLEGWLNAYRAGGWLPKWASPGYRDSMVGTFADVVLSDAIIKNISGFDVDMAWEALRKDAFDSSSDPKDTSRGKFGLQHYKDRGYIPVDVKIGEACSRTLDFAYADAATAMAAERLGKGEVARELRQRSERGLRELYDPRTGLMGHKQANGAFKNEPAETWGDCFTEGSAWHHSFPPFNLKVLTELHGGSQKLIAKLRELFTTPGDFNVGSYKVEIHEMREMRMLGLGQYAHNNQPVHHLPFLFALLGDRNATARMVRRILSSAYSPEGFAGDEDNGEMGSWYVLSALGLFAPSPGVSADYMLASMPLFRRVHLRALDIVIEAPAASQEAPLVTEVFWRSQPVKGVLVPYQTLQVGGTLHFQAPGDKKLNRVVSSLRGALHGAIKKARGAVRKVRGATTAFEHSPSLQEDLGLGPPSAAVEDGQLSIVTGAALVASLVFCGLAAKRFIGPHLLGTTVKPD